METLFVGYISCLIYHVMKIKRDQKQDLMLLSGSVST